MFEQPEIYQAAVSVWFRGPEWAFAIREGDLDALEWVLRNCRFWNGANSLIVPVRADGRTWPLVDQLLRVKPVETCHLHESVPARARDRLRQRLDPFIDDWGELWDGFDERELHPLLLQPSYRGETERPSLIVPRFASRRLRRIALVTWGDLPADELSEYRRGFNISEVLDGPIAHKASLDGQLSALSPLAQSTTLIRHYGAVSFGRQLWIFGRASFGELVAFWNLRSRMRDVDETPLLIGIAREALLDRETLPALARWLESGRITEQTPDLGVAAAERDREVAREALTAVGFNEHSGHTLSRRLGGAGQRGPLSFGFFRTSPRGPIKRGALAHDQLTLTRGRASYRIARPPEFGARSGHSIRVAIDGLPLAFPLTPALAAAVVNNAYPSPEGLTIHTSATAGDGYLPIAIPDTFERLRLWAAATGDVKLSSAGRYAQALLERLVTLDDLGTLASERALAILTALAPLSRKKLAQSLVAEAQTTGAELDEQALARLLQRGALFLELRARTVGDIASEAGVRKPDLLPAVERLVAAGFVTRGAAVTCPRCGYRDVLSLREQDESVACRACREQFLLPVADSGGQTERPTVYRLDGLMARALDQDLLPVLLALNRLRRGDPPLRAAWPGVELHRADGTSEYDLVVSDGEHVWVAECKARAGGVPLDQLDGLLTFCRRHRARPVLAALDGTFTANDREAVTELNGLVLERDQLVTP